MQQHKLDANIDMNGCCLLPNTVSLCLRRVKIIYKSQCPYCSRLGLILRWLLLNLSCTLVYKEESISVEKIQSPPEQHQTWYLLRFVVHKILALHCCCRDAGGGFECMLIRFFCEINSQFQGQHRKIGICQYHFILQNRNGFSLMKFNVSSFFNTSQIQFIR